MHAKSSYVQIKEIKDVTIGRSSALFKQFDEQKSVLVDPKCCLSVLCEKRTYDFEFEEALECEIYLVVLKFLLQFCLE